MVGGKLHDERSGIARKHSCLLEHDAGDDDGGHTDEVCGGCDPCGAVEDGARDHGDKGNLGSAGDKGRSHDRHAAVTLVLDRSGSHNAGNAAARADQHGDEGFAGKAEFPENTVQNEGDSGHIAARLEEGQHEEEDQHLWNKSKHRADAGDNAVQDQTLENTGNSGFVEDTLDDDRDAGNPCAVFGGIRFSALVFCEGLNRAREILCRIGDIFRGKCLLVLQGVVCCRAWRDTADRGSDAIHIDIALLVSKVVNSYKSIDNIEGIAVFLCIRLISSCPVTEKMPAVSEESVVCPVCGGGADPDHGDPVDKKHDRREDRKTQPAVGDDPVDLIRGRQFADSVLFITGFNELRDIIVALIGDNTLSVVIEFRLGGLDVFFDMGERFLRNIEVLQDFLVSLKNLDRIPALLFFREVVYNGFLDMRDRMLDGPGEGVLRNGFVPLRGINCALRRLHDAGSLQRGDPHHAASQLL